MSKESGLGLARLSSANLSDAETFKAEWGHCVWSNEDYQLFLGRLIQVYCASEDDRRVLANNEALWECILQVRKGGFAVFEALMGQLVHLASPKLLEVQLQKATVHPYARLLTALAWRPLGIKCHCSLDLSSGVSLFRGLSSKELLLLVERLLSHDTEGRAVFALFQNPAFDAKLSVEDKVQLLLQVLIKYPQMTNASSLLAEHLMKAKALSPSSAVLLASAYGAYPGFDTAIVTMLARFDLADLAHQPHFNQLCHQLKKVAGVAELLLQLFQKDSFCDFTKAPFAPAFYDLLASSDQGAEALRAFSHDAYGIAQLRKKTPGASAVIEESLFFYQNRRAPLGRKTLTELTR